MSRSKPPLVAVKFLGFSIGARKAFTLIELLVVMAIIAILTGLILSVVGYVQGKGTKNRAVAEIAALEQACDSYKVDNGAPPRDANTTDLLDPRTVGNPSKYMGASLKFYQLLTGDTNASGIATTSYFPQMNPNMLGRATPSSPASAANPVLYLQDPYGNSYGYSTAHQANATMGYNPTFDLWSTAGLTQNPPATSQLGSSTDPTISWIKNW